MTDFVTLEAAKAALRIDHDDDDATLAALISAASDMVAEYLKDNAPDPDYPETASQRVQTAVIMLVGIIYRSPDGDDNKMFADGGYLPIPVQAILYPLRTPTLT
jgi:uncharacterized phage protein (predicted DNA packaging)